MGCDIHFYVEKREGDKWISADKWTPDKWSEDGSLAVDYDDRFYRSRNYDLFAMLADVRNGVGFAGCDTGDGFNPIATPKGLPDDVSPEVKKESGDYGVDGHSHSYLTLSELEAYDWHGQKTKQRGWVGALEFMNFQVKGHPSSWSGGVMGQGVRHVSNKEMAELVERHSPALNALAAELVDDPFRDFANVPTELKSVYTQVEWEESYAEPAKEFLDETMPKLRELANGNPDSVRIVFWFDN